MYIFVREFLDLDTDQDLVSAVGWTSSNELYSCSDDKTVFKWEMTGEANGKVRAIMLIVRD